MRLLLALLAGLGYTTSAIAAPQVTIRWHGQSFFEIISSKGTRIVTDPHAIEVYGRLLVPADLVLISHLHDDHTALESVQNHEKARVIWGLKATGRKTDWQPVDETFRDVHVRSVGVYHDDQQGMERGKNTVFVIDVDGLHIVFLGDLGHLLTPAQLRQIGPVDVLLIPVGGVYTINGSDAKRVAAQLKPRQYIIPMHCGTNIYDDLLSPEEFLEDQKNVKRLRTNELKVDRDFQPAEPVIAVLNWRKGPAREGDDR